MSSGTRTEARRLELALIALAAIILIWGLAHHPAAAALATLGLVQPAVGAVRSGRLPGRGTVASGVALIFGALLIRPTSGALPWVELATVGGMALSAQVMGKLADAARPAYPFGVPDLGRRAAIVVECDGPTGPSGRSIRPVFSPDPRPERRALASLAERHRPAGRPHLPRVS